MDAQPSALSLTPAAPAPLLRRLAVQFLKVALLWNPLAVSAVVAFISGFDRFLRTFLVSYFISLVVSFVCLAVIGVVRFWEERRAQRTGRPQPRHGRAWHFGLSLSSMPLGLWLGLEGARALFGIPLSWRDYRFGFFLGTLIALLFFLWQAQVDAREAAREAETLTLQAQLSALSAQLNPHLLFNALNTVAALIPTQPAEAEDMVVKVAALLRRTLASAQHATHRLADELELCRTYLAIETARFGDRLRVQVDAVEGPCLGQQVPVLLLQPLVENAITHGLSEKSSGGVLQIVAQCDGMFCTVRVEDNGLGLGRSLKSGAGLGVALVRKRLALYFGERATLTLAPGDGGGCRAVLRFPLRSP